MSDLLKKKFVVTMPDETRWAVPVELIARDRAKHYADEFDGDVERSLLEDTVPLFEADDYEIEDWAANNMNWSDVSGTAECIYRPAEGANYQEGWMNGEKEVLPG